MTRTCVMEGCVRTPRPMFFVCTRHLHDLFGAFGRHEGGALPGAPRPERAALAAAAGASVAREG